MARVPGLLRRAGAGRGARGARHAVRGVLAGVERLGTRGSATERGDAGVVREGGLRGREVPAFGGGEGFVKSPLWGAGGGGGIWREAGRRGDFYIYMV